MSAPLAQITSIVINVTDFDRQKAFWLELLGVEVLHEIAPHFVWFTQQQPGAPSVALQTVADATEGPRRLHLDTQVDDVDAARSRIIELGGAHLADREIDGFRWTVMADPEGNEFYHRGTANGTAEFMTSHSGTTRSPSRGTPR